MLLYSLCARVFVLSGELSRSLGLDEGLLSRALYTLLVWLDLLLGRRAEPVCAISAAATTNSLAKLAFPHHTLLCTALFVCMIWSDRFGFFFGMSVGISSLAVHFHYAN